MKIRYFKKLLNTPRQANNGKDCFYDTLIIHFRCNSELEDTWQDPKSLKDYLENGWEISDGWEFGAINNGVSIDEWKRLQHKAWKDRDIDIRST